MEQKVKYLIYLDPRKGISAGRQKKLHISMMGASLIVWGLGMVTHNILLMILFAVWHIINAGTMYWVFSRRLVKTFRSKFLMNGLDSLLLSSLFLLILYTLASIKQLNIIWWILGGFLLFVPLYCGLIVLGVHANFFKKIKEFNRTKISIAISALLSPIVLISSILGWQRGKILRRTADEETQLEMCFICLSLAVFLPALGFVNFVQYFYCIKYHIQCDEDGISTFPLAEELLYYKEKKK